MIACIGRIFNKLKMGRTVDMPDREKDKIEIFIEALSVAVKEGFDAWCIFTQAWHETGGFEHIIGDHNYWGIKRPRVWTGKTHLLKTTEFIRGTEIMTSASFIDFDTAEEAIKWYMGLVKRLYPEAYGHRNNPPEYFSWLVAGAYQWATDPKYVGKLMNVYQSWKKKERWLESMKNIQRRA